MCFSAPVSFSAGAVLASAGAYCVKKSVEKDRRYLPLATIPFFSRLFCRFISRG